MESNTKKSRKGDAKKEEIDDHVEKQARSNRNIRITRSMKGNRSNRSTKNMPKNSSCFRR